jgi:hypothetical protein
MRKSDDVFPLNLPAYEYQLQKDADRIYIYDNLRKKYIVLTPEEWVRQHFIQYLLNQHQYPKSLIKVEGGLSYNTLAKRSDIVVFSREGTPWMVVECKAPTQPLNEQTLLQASTYNKTLQAPYVVVTNGISHFYFSVDWNLGKTIALPELPAYPLSQ